MSADKIIQFRVLGNHGLGAEIGSAVALELDGKVFSPIHDISGNVIALLDISGNIAETYRYTAFGEEQIFNSKNKPITRSAVKNPWRFSSKRFDEESTLVCFGRRYYSPSLGRWITQDPIGYEAGPNLYAYVSNNPLICFDLYGLYTLIADDNYLMRQIRPVEFNEYENLCSFVNSDFERSSNFDLGLKNIPNTGIGFTNGIWNSKADAMSNAEYYSGLAGGLNILVSHNATHGFLDPIECFYNFHNYATNPVGILHKKWDNFFDNSTPDANFLETMFSQGALIGKLALSTYSAERRNRIFVVAIAPAAYIDPSTCRKVFHYRAHPCRDFVPYLDIMGMINAFSTTTTLPSHEDANFFDHEFQSPTYQSVLKKHVKKYIKTQGKSI